MVAVFAAAAPGAAGGAAPGAVAVARPELVMNNSSLVPALSPAPGPGSRPAARNDSNGAVAVVAGAGTATATGRRCRPDYRTGPVLSFRVRGQRQQRPVGAALAE